MVGLMNAMAGPKRLVELHVAFFRAGNACPLAIVGHGFGEEPKVE